MNSRNLRSTSSTLLGIGVFSTFYFVIGFAVAVTASALRLTSVSDFAELVAKVWWFPSLQIHQYYRLRGGMLNALMPVANSLLWGAVLFTLWKVRYKRDFTFGLRAVFIATTVLAMLMGFITYVIRNYLGP